MSGVTLDWWMVVPYVGLVLLALGGLWMIVPGVHGTPGTPSRPYLIREALKLADLQPGETIYDLGAGDGRVVVLGAREFGARGVGIEVEPLHCLVAWLRVLSGGVLGRVSIRPKNFFDADWGDADVIFLFLAPALLPKLAPHLILKLRPGVRVISVHFPFEGWQPSAMDVGNLIFVYSMPPHPGSVDAFFRASFGLAPRPSSQEPDIAA
ncbi:MAG: hypothetical protein JW934_13645 [Anaerolineae bacterium]|nr:hypothetical protein [Anaerolineae bacterium]